MLRLFSALFAALLFGAVFFLPKGDRPRLAAQKTFELVVDGTTTDAQGAEVPLAELLFATEAMQTGADGKKKFLLGGARLADPETAADDLEVHGALRDALVRGIRQRAVADGLEVELVGDRMPAVLGLSFLLEVSDPTLALTWNMPGGEPTRREFPWVPPGRNSLLPPLVAICLALLLRRPVPALFAGVLTAAYLLRHEAGASVVSSTAQGVVDVFRVFFWEQFSDGSKAQTIAFVIGMLAMVGIITRNGGIQGIMQAVARLASSVRSTQFAAYLMGLAVFFDDYANTILVGGTMRPLTDKFRISREKLSYIVDSTAAPVAGISIFSTWIAFEVSTFSAQLPMAGRSTTDGYAVFIDTLPYRFYCIFSIVLVGIVTLGGRDLGPMLGAERRARTTGKVVRDGGQPLVSDLATAMQPAPGLAIRAYRAVLPLLVFVGVALFEILRKGGAFGMSGAEFFSLEGLTQVLYDGSGSWPLMAGSLAGAGLAVVLSLAAGMRMEILDAVWKTLRSMGIALAILYLAWMLAAACTELGTAQYLTVSLGNLEFPMFLPIVLFLLSCGISFATGTSWGTMGILLPLVVGLSYELGSRVAIGGTPAGDATGYFLMILSIGAVLEGSIFGDHCSPISDTTVLSSIASASDHVDHVRTQIPYALLCMVIAIVVGYMPCAAFKFNPWISIATGVVTLIFTMRLLGRRPEDQPEKDKRAFV